MKEGRSVLFIKSLQTGSEQKHCVTPGTKRQCGQPLAHCGSPRERQLSTETRNLSWAGNAAARERLPCSQPCDKLQFCFLYQTEVDRYLCRSHHCRTWEALQPSVGWHCVYTAHALVDSFHLLMLCPLFPSWRKEHSFLLHKGPSVSENFISPLPASS